MSKENNKVSVLISTYNNEDCIRESVESIQKQTYKELEILIIDDGSNDGTLKICENLAVMIQELEFLKMKIILIDEVIKYSYQRI